MNGRCVRLVRAVLSERVLSCVSPGEFPFRSTSASLPDARTSQELVTTFTPSRRTVGVAAVAALLATACASHPADGPHFSESSDHSNPAATPWRSSGRGAGVPDTQIQIPIGETVLMIKSGVGNATTPVVLPAVPAIVLYGRCSGGTHSLELHDGSGQKIVVPCGPVQVRQQFADGPIRVIGDPSTRWTIVATRPPT